MNKLIFANLLHRPLRSIISVLAVAIEVIMMLTIIAIMMGQLTGQKRMNNGIGADLIVRPSNAIVFNGVGGAPITAKLAPFLATLPHVAVASPVITNLSMSDGVEVLWGIDYPTYSRLSPFVFLSGGPIQDPYDVIVDDVFASSGQGHKVGDTILIQKHPFRISGIFEHGKGGRKLISIVTMGEMMGSEGKASAFYIKADRPENVNQVTTEIHSTTGLENYQVMTMEEWYSLMTPERIPALTTAINVVIGIAVIIGFLVIFQSMYTSVLERTREIGILKSMGASKLDHRRRRPARNRGACRCRRPGGRGAVVCRQGLPVAEVPHALSRHEHGLGSQGRGHRLCRLAVRRALSRLDGRPQRPHRRAGLRIARPKSSPTP